MQHGGFFVVQKESVYESRHMKHDDDADASLVFSALDERQMSALILMAALASFAPATRLLESQQIFPS